MALAWVAMMERPTVYQRMVAAAADVALAGGGAAPLPEAPADDEQQGAAEDEPVEPAHEKIQEKRRKHQDAEQQFSQDEQVEAPPSPEDGRGSVSHGHAPGPAGWRRGGGAGHSVRQLAEEGQARVHDSGPCRAWPRSGRRRPRVRPGRPCPAGLCSGRPSFRRDRGFAPAPIRRNPSRRSRWASGTRRARAGGGGPARSRR